MAGAPTGQEIEKVIEEYKQWQLGGGHFKGPQEVLPLVKFREGSDRLHNLKCLPVRKFLQWEKWSTPTINLGYTDNAEPETAKKVARWFFARPNGSDGPITYGETIALGYGTEPSFYRYEDRPVGINIKNVATPVFEWKLLGLAAGQPVKTGEQLAIYNEKDTNILIFFDRGPGQGVDLGWPDSRTISQVVQHYAWEAVKEAFKAYAEGQSK